MATNGFIYRFTVLPPAARGTLDSLLRLAAAEAELVFGKARLKLETSYGPSAGKMSCVVEGGTECGEHLAKLLAGFLIKQVGESGFLVKRLQRNPARNS